ncbi:MAG TPA: hypothetical protein VHE34_12960 [Puia sp.]|uniref:hypothetical protein n=1 Tax=Puia sp. TaxID=2045100 RepID=UPI002BF40A1D|nr:hypothetical protein [Puia sp.]HVU96133.1 hypothetical protein [Puia sp.]
MPSPNRWHILFVCFGVAVYSLFGCSKNSDNNNNNKHDSDTLPKKKVYDSAVFYVSFLMNVYKSSDVFNDTFSDDASMKIYIVNGVVTVPHDSILNFPPVVFPASGSSGGWSATWIPDNIGEINITAANGLVIPGDTTVAISLTQTGAVTPNWNLCFGNSCSPTGNQPSVGWPLAFTFNPKKQSQDAFKLEQPGSYWDIWVYKDY